MRMPLPLPCLLLLPAHVAGPGTRAIDGDAMALALRSCAADVPRPPTNGIDDGIIDLTGAHP